MSDMSRFRIVNTFDRPLEALIAELRDDGRLYYVHPKFASYKCFKRGMDADKSTPVEDFGITLRLENGVLYGDAIRASIATYGDGRTRRWQGASSFSFEIQKQ